MADFGYSTLAAGETGKVLLPKSRPWNAPEHHFGEFTVGDAKKTDVYSFGMLCLWILFGDSPLGILQTTAEGTTEFISFDAPPRFRPRTYLEQLKDDDKVEHVVSEHIESMIGWHTEQRTCLKEFFRSTLQRGPEKRTSDFARLVSYMSNKR
jgi:serine/threonine protein kinase